MSFAGIYVHIPFCQAKCAYCDFCSYAGLEHLHTHYVGALCQEIVHRGHDWADASFDTIYIGGGTPTVLAPSAIAQILDVCRHSLSVADDAEITIEANPGTVEQADLVTLRQAGIVRLSLGVQSFQANELVLLGRIHNVEGALRAYRLARRAGFQNVNLDLIFGLPEQHLESWRETLGQALALEPEHLSLYALTLEEGTPLAERIARGVLPVPDDDLAADMYELAESLLEEAGYIHYEISNWARRSREDGLRDAPARACRHNLKYWRTERYLGLGAASHSYDGRCRYANTASPAEYIARVSAGQSAIVERQDVGPERRMEETMILGLRLMAGITWRDFAQRHGIELREVYGREINDLAEQGLLEVDADDSRSRLAGVRLSTRGRLLGNRVFGAFLR